MGAAPAQRRRRLGPGAAVPARSILPALALLAGLSLGACGGNGEPGTAEDATPSERRQATLVLDFVPNAVHAGIYRALAAGYYEDANIDLEIIEPSSTADTLKLIDSGRAEFGIAAGIDVANQIEAGRGAKGVMALVQRPLGGLITLEEAGIDDPAQLEGRAVGVTGVPSDAAILDAVVADAGGDPSRIEVVTIGFNGVQALENGRVDAFTGFIAADGTQIEQDGFPIRSFALDDYGGPEYPGLVVFSTEERIDEDPELLEGFVEATVRGYDDTLADPERSLEDLAAENPALDPELMRAQLQAYEPLFRADAPEYGSFAAESLVALSDFLVSHGIASAPIAPDRYATNEFVPGR